MYKIVSQIDSFRMVRYLNTRYRFLSATKGKLEQNGQLGDNQEKSGRELRKLVSK